MPLSGMGVISPAYGLNHYRVDVPFRELLESHAPPEGGVFEGLGGFAGSLVYEVAHRVDRLSGPVLVNWGVNGERADVAWLDPLEREVVFRLLREYKVNSYPYTGGSWHHHYASIYLVGDPGIGCILTITMQTGYTLYKYGGDEIKPLYRRLAGLEEPVMIGATWFTEAQGGSDLGANATTAFQESGGLYRVTGYKYFASGAGIADIALVTARLPGSPEGAKGISLFAVPRLNKRGSLNFHVRRLKWKSGTIPVPTGEVELEGSEAYLIGEPGKGIYYTLESLMVSRLANSIGALGIARKAYLEAYGYASVRKAFGRRIKDHLLVLRDLLECEVELEAMLALTLHAVTLFNDSWRLEPPYGGVYHHARLLAHIVKNMTAEASARITQAAMEIFGGIGFLHEFPVERWHREALITPIWEGTSNIQALDMLEAIRRKRAHEPYMEALEELASESQEPRLAEEALKESREAVKRALESPVSAEFNAKEILRILGRSAAVILLLRAARLSKDPLFSYVAELYHEMSLRGGLKDLPDKRLAGEIISLRGSLEEVEWEEKLKEHTPGAP